MSLITICIPAHESHPFIRATLTSVANQDFRKFKVIVAIEPTENWMLTKAICSEFSDLMAVQILVNDSVKGWAGNISYLLSLLETPYFTILPHDDMIHPAYLSTLHKGFESQRTLGVCYADMVFFGHHSGSKFRSYEGATLFKRLRAFYLGGAEAVPWRGVTRTALIAQGLIFNTNKWNSIWVECEYAQSILSLAKVRRIPKGLYYKRIHEPQHLNVSTSWHSYDENELSQAFDHHRQAMLTGIPRAKLGWYNYQRVKALYLAAMLRRASYAFSPHKLSEYQAETLEEIEKLKWINNHPARSMVMVVKSEIEHRRGNLGLAKTYARESLELNLENGEAHLQMAKIYLKMKKPFHASTFLQQANKLVPNDPMYLQLHKQFIHQVAAFP